MSQQHIWESAISDLAKAVASKHGFALRLSKFDPRQLAKSMEWELAFSEDTLGPRPLLGGRDPWAWGPIWSEEQDDFISTDDSRRVFSALVDLGAIG